MRTRSPSRARVAWLLAALLLAPAALSAQQLSAGDTLHIRLLNHVHSHHHVRPEVRALVIAPVTAADGRTVVAPGSLLYGRMAGSGKEHFGGKRHWLALQFDSVAAPIGDAPGDTITSALSLRIVAVDNAREIVDSAGRIVGPPIPSVIRSKREWAAALLGVFHPVGAIVLAATMEGEMAERHRAVSLEAGAELTVVLTRDLTLARFTEWTAPPPIAGAVNADSIVAAAPLRAELRDQHTPSDVIGIALIGSLAQLRAALGDAGWTRAVPMSVRTDFVTFVRAAKGEGYEAQPVSELVLGARPPNDVYEKVADTFLKRHHFRVWRWPLGAAAGDSTAIWLIAATHDTGLMFSNKRHSFTHTVDPHIDLERDKIVSDLVAADHVAAMSYVSRAAPANGATVNGGRTAAITDWRMAVLVLK